MTGGQRGGGSAGIRGTGNVLSAPRKLGVFSSIPKLTAEAPKELSYFKRGLVLGSSENIEVPKKIKKATLRLMRKYDNMNVKTLLYEEKRRYLSLSTTRVRQRLCNLMGTDVIRLNDKRYFQKLSEKLQEEYESIMDKEEDARVASENERLRRLMLEGVIDNPQDYRAVIHGEHNKHRHTKKKKKRTRRKKRVESEKGTEEGTATLTSQASEDTESQEQDEVVTQIEILSRPNSSVGASARSKDKRAASARIRSSSGSQTKKDRKKVTEEGTDDKENEEEKRFSEMHVPPPHRPSSSCSLRRKRMKSASARVSHWDESRESDEETESETEDETRSLPDTQRTQKTWKYSKKEKPLVQNLRREETVEGLYSIAEELISPVKTEEYEKKVHQMKPKKKKMTVNF